MQIKRADAGDFGEIFKMVNELADHEKDTNPNPFETFVKSFQDKNVTALVAKIAEKSVGYAIYFREFCSCSTKSFTCLILYKN